MWKDFFLYTRSEQRGIIVLLVLILIVLVARFTMPHWAWYFVSLQSDNELFVHQINALNAEIVRGNNNKHLDSLFCFNPNKVTESELIKLGFSNYQLKSFIGYRSKVGQFKSKSDLLKIYGIDSVIFNKLEKYIVLPAEVFESKMKLSQTIQWINFNKVGETFWLENVSSDVIREKIELLIMDNQIVKSLPLKTVKKYSDEQVLAWLIKNGKPRQKIPKVITRKLIVELNSADTSKLKSLNGIGDKLSVRIVKFRNALGGFYDKSQLNEVYGISDELYKSLESYVIVDPKHIEKLDLEKGKISNLVKHPYFTYEQIKELKNLRRKTKGLNKEKVLKLKAIKNSDWQQMKFYLKLDLK